MRFLLPTRWDLSPAAAAALQRELAPRVRQEDPEGFPDTAQLIGGVDVAVGRFGEDGRAAAVAWRVADGALVEAHAVRTRVTVPYIPGLLAFRELPLLEQALALLAAEPDVLLVDGHGTAHPRRFGIASHLGVLLDRPTIGVAKSRLTGKQTEPGPAFGDRTPLLAENGEVIGMVVRTRPGARPVYVSVGQRITLPTAVEVVLRCCRGYRLPEPVRIADLYSKGRMPETAP
ncbi:MAG: endonuclease V [Armatimonadetes bacterium]|nr:endonuclease V [Armatimonadota bacterium]